MLEKTKQGALINLGDLYGRWFAAGLLAEKFTTNFRYNLCWNRRCHSTWYPSESNMLETQ